MNTKPIFKKTLQSLVLGCCLLSGKLLFSQTVDLPVVAIGEKQLHVYPTDNSSGLPWGPDGVAFGATSIIDGNNNTLGIVNEHGNWNQGNYAAMICAELNAFGHSDWYLPARDELQAMYQNRSLIGNFSSGYYWSSTHDNWGYDAYVFDAFSGFSLLQPKFNLNRVRCIRRAQKGEAGPDHSAYTEDILGYDSVEGLHYWINLEYDDRKYALFTDSERSFAGEAVFSIMNKDKIHGIYVKDIAKDRFLCEDNEVKRRSILMLAENKARHLNTSLEHLQSSLIRDLEVQAFSRTIQTNPNANDLQPDNLNQAGIGGLLNALQDSQAFGHGQQTLYYPSFESQNIPEIASWGDLRVWFSLTGSGLYHYNKRKNIYKNIVYALIIPEYGSQSSDDDSVFRQFEDEYDRLYGDVYDNALAETINHFHELPASTTALSVFTGYYASGLENQLFDAASDGMVLSSGWLHLSWVSGLQSALSHYSNVTGVVGIGHSAFAASTRALMLQAYSAGLAQQRLSALENLISSGIYNESIPGYDQAFVDALWEVNAEFSDYQNNFWWEVVRDIVNDYSFWRSTLTFGSVKIASQIYGKAASITAAKVLLPVAILHWAWDEVTSSNTLAQQIALSYSLNQSFSAMISHDTGTYDKLITQLYLQEWKRYLSYYFYGNYVRLMDYNIITGRLRQAEQWIKGGSWNAYKQLHEDFSSVRHNLLRMFVNYHAPYFGLAPDEYTPLLTWAFGLLSCKEQVEEEKPIYSDGTFTDPRDGQTYRYVQIGDQVWMAENLRYLPSVSGPGNGSTITPFYYVYGYNGNNVSAAKATENFRNYGVLYNWPAARNACPPGWKLPSHTDWTQLEQYICNTLGNLYCETQFPYDNSWGWRGTNESNALKSCRQVNSPLDGACDSSEHPRWDSNDTHNGFDQFDFSALPGGGRVPNGNFGYLGALGGWWSSTEYSYTTAWGRAMRRNGGDVYRVYDDKTNGTSLRCVREP